MIDAVSPRLLHARVLLAGMAVLMLSGCVAAAAALPFVAGAALSKTQVGASGQAAPTPAAPASPTTASALARSDLRIVATSLTALPPSDAIARPADPAVASFRAYALARSEIQPGKGKRPSAIIPAASDLRPVRSDCGNAPAAVFLDLDPGRGSFDPLAPGTPDAALASALAELRGKGVAVAWFSRLGDNFVAAVRTALARGGLDPAGSDRLVLMRSIGERKQSRRDEVARDLCPVAMLGDERADFDELYLYLKQPDAAMALDAMIDQGWFLASPFHPAGPAPANGETP